MASKKVDRPGVHRGYDLWAESYDRTANALVALAEHSGVEYRLGAYRYSVDDYLNMIADAGFRRIAWREFAGDHRVAVEVPAAAKYLGRPLLLVIEAHRQS